MRLGIVSEWYDPETGSPAVVGTVARALLADGHDVRVLTGFPNYPSGRIAAGYRLRPAMSERLLGIDVHRVWLFPSHDASIVRRALTYLTFALTATLWGIRRLRDVDVVLVFCSPVTVTLPAMVLRRLYGVPVVLFVQDIWPETVWASGLAGGGTHGPLPSLLRRLCDRAYRSADRVAVITPGARTALAARTGHADRIDLVHNWVDEQVYRPRPRPAVQRRSFVVMYAGSVGHVQGLDAAVRAMALLPVDSPVRLHVLGDGVAVPGLVALVRDLHLTDRVTFSAAVPPPAATERMAEADAQLVSLRDAPLFRYTLPSKVQASLACALPIVAAVAGDTAELVRRSAAGIVCPPGDVAALAAAFQQLQALPDAELARMGSRGREFYLRELCEDVGVAALVRSLSHARHGSERVSA